MTLGDLLDFSNEQSALSALLSLLGLGSCARNELLHSEPLSLHSSPAYPKSLSKTLICTLHTKAANLKTHFE